MTEKEAVLEQAVKEGWLSASGSSRSYFKLGVRSLILTDAALTKTAFEADHSSKCNVHSSDCMLAYVTAGTDFHGARRAAARD